MTPDQFVAKWRQAQLSEKAASHSHFNDLCALLSVKNPIEADPAGHDYTFEKPVHPIAAASKGSKGDRGFVDVWKRGHFAWEYKRQGKYKDLTEAYRQLYQYRDNLDKPHVLRTRISSITAVMPFRQGLAGDTLTEQRNGHVHQD